MTLEVVTLPLGIYQTNCYLAALPGSSQAAVIDPGDAPEQVLEALQARGWTAAGILVTHGHFDHLGAIAGVAAATGAEVLMPRAEAHLLRDLDTAPYEPDHLLDGDEIVTVAGIEFTVHSVPGHSPASVAYSANGVAFIGDVLFAGSIGRTDLDGGDLATLLASIARLMEALPPETVVCPGHGETTTLGHERETNPFLQELRA